MERWEPVEVALTYRLGEIELFSKRLCGFACRTHFSALPARDRLPVPPRELEARTRFVFYPTYPVTFTPRPIEAVGNWIAYTPYTFRNYFVDLKRIGSFEAYLQGFSPKSRSTLRRKVRKFIDAGNAALDRREYTRPEQMDEFFAHARALSAVTYQERLLDNGLPASDAFRHDMAQAAHRGGVYASILFLRARPVSYALCLSREGVVSYDYVGYDPQARELSPGTVLQYLVLEALFGRGDVSIFDFTEGEGEQKAFFGSDWRLCAKTYLLARSAANFAFVAAHHRLNRGVERVGGVLDRFGLKARVRNLVRRLA